ncbi:hypothetical protein OE88DRAFT_873667 [Heliocybe sulcata]|uniref:Uncharacterized protein n=1 Tax=Heliocybe sulcata TaxID=5364 RepID=A0A5C3MP90_9AGAM|nr:hypothetical protein OE88DRAFT_873667 [Heliocybe sulcata]
MDQMYHRLLRVFQLALYCFTSAVVMNDVLRRKTDLAWWYTKVKKTQDDVLGTHLCVATSIALSFLGTGQSVAARRYGDAPHRSCTRLGKMLIALSCILVAGYRRMKPSCTCGSQQLTWSCSCQPVEASSAVH